MWLAMGLAYTALNRHTDAAKCNERAEVSKDREGIAVNRLAHQYAALGDSSKAAYYYKKNLEKREAEKV